MSRRISFNVPRPFWAGNRRISAERSKKLYRVLMGRQGRTPQVWAVVRKASLLPQVMEAARVSALRYEGASCA
jgi:hypothetical protein